MNRLPLVDGATQLLAGACPSSAPQGASYTFDPQRAAVRVDTPALRTLKSAGVDFYDAPPCCAGISA